MSENRKHLYGLDVLRILSMYYVCVLHVGGGFGALKSSPDVITQCGTALFIALADVAVNIFMMVTGYIGVCHHWSWKGYLRVWGQVAFYAIAGFLFARLLMGQSCSSAALLRMFFPIPFANGYWYFTAYTGAYFLFPYANRLLQNLSPREYGRLLIILLVSVSFFGIWNQSIWGGYNAVWLLVMYAVGGYIRLHLGDVSQWRAVGIYLLASGLSALLFATKIYVKKNYGCVLGIPSFGYTAPLTIIASLSCFVCFAKMEIRNPLLCRLLTFAAPLTFAVYLIHVHPAVEPFFRRLASAMGSYDHYALWHTPFTALMIYLICSSVDWCRREALRVCMALWLRIRG